MLVACRWGGERYESEFSFGGEAHLERPQESCSDKEWTEYIFMRINFKGEQKERWMHINGCRQWFNAVRNTTTNTFLQTSKPGGNYTNIKTNDH